MTVLPPIENSYWVEPGKFLAGEYPRDVDDESSIVKLRKLLDGGVTHFVDLTEDDERLKRYAPMLDGLSEGRAVHKRFGIRDMSIPSSPALVCEILDCIGEVIANGGIAYLHCLGGVGRTGTMVGCYLVRQGLSGEEALGRLQELWKHCEKSKWRISPERGSQVNYVLGWDEANCRKDRGGFR